MKRYIMFGGETYYPRGGAEDYINEFDTIEECELYMSDIPEDIMMPFEEYYIADDSDSAYTILEWINILDTIEYKYIRYDKIDNIWRKNNNE